MAKWETRVDKSYTVEERIYKEKLASEYYWSVLKVLEKKDLVESDNLILVETTLKKAGLELSLIEYVENRCCDEL